VAETDALVISSGFATTRIAWSSVLAVEVWHRLNRVDYVALHYRAPNGNSVATCWEQGSREELLLFVRHCAKLAQIAGPRRSIAFANLRDREVFAPLLRRSSVDLAMALLAGVLCGITGRAIELGVAASFLSTVLAAVPFRYREELVRSDDGVWCRRAKTGELTPLRVIPRSLALWIRALSESARSMGG
jgi:hypothetical protein